MKNFTQQISQSSNSPRENSSKIVLTNQITQWLNKEIREGSDSHIKQIFGFKEFQPNDFFHQADSLRLRAAGYQLLSSFFEHENFLHHRAFYSGEILKLSRNLNAPFYLNANKLVLFGHENIVHCKICGSVEAWLDQFDKS